MKLKLHIKFLLASEFFNESRQISDSLILNLWLSASRNLTERAKNGVGNFQQLVVVAVVGVVVVEEKELILVVVVVVVVW